MNAANKIKELLNIGIVSGFEDPDEYADIVIILGSDYE